MILEGTRGFGPCGGLSRDEALSESILVGNELKSVHDSVV